MSDLDDAYANGAYIEGAEEFPPRWAEAAQGFRDAASCRLAIPYGPGDRHRFDLFLPEGAPKGLTVFVHGGYWRAFDRTSWSHLAAGPLAHDWAVAMPSYDLCPDVHIADITQQISECVMAAAAEVEGPITLSGHSAGGHLVARMLDRNMLPADIAARIVHVAPISPLSDLRPLLQTAMNDDFQMDLAEAEAESPLMQPKPDTSVTVWVGADERPAFIDQARWLSEAWGCGLQIVPGKHHFDVIDALADPGSEIVKELTPSSS